MFGTFFYCASLHPNVGDTLATYYSRFCLMQASTVTLPQHGKAVASEPAMRLVSNTYPSRSSTYDVKTVLI